MTKPEPHEEPGGSDQGEIEKDPAEEVDGEAVEELDDPQVQRIVSIVEQYAGPVPHPNIAAGYEELLPGATDRLLKMAEKEGERRHEYAMEDLSEGHRSVRLGIVTTTLAVTLISLAALAAAVIFVLNGANPYVISAIMIAVGLLGLRPGIGHLKGGPGSNPEGNEVVSASTEAGGNEK